MGYKPEQFVEKVDENLICAICREVLKDPWGCKDGHTFCKDCIKQCLMTHQRCPMDNRALQVNDLVPNLIAKNMVANLNVFCHPSKNDGQDGEPEQCEWKGKLQHLEKHQETCPFYPVRCPNAKCNTWMQRRGMKYHVKICKYAVVMCMKCRKALIRYVLEHHIAHECPETLIDCPNKCLNQQQQINQIKRGDLKNHRTNICVKRMVDCPFKDQGCSVQVVQQDVDMHVQQNMAEHMMLLAKENKILKEEVNQLKKNDELSRTYVWKTPDFSSSRKYSNYDQCFRSPDFYLCGYRWYLEGSCGHGARGSLFVRLRLNESSPERDGTWGYPRTARNDNNAFEFNCRLSVLSHEQGTDDLTLVEEEYQKESRNSNGCKSKVFRWPQLLESEQLLSPYYDSRGYLSIKCTISKINAMPSIK